MSDPTVQPVADTAERAFIGTLMWVPLDQLAPLLDIVHDDDVNDPRLRGVLAIARTVAAVGDRPDPVTLTTRYADDYGARALQGFTDTVTDLYTQPPLPGYNARAYAAATLKAALRRAVRELGYLAQHADTEPLPALLAECRERIDRVSKLQERLSNLTANQTSKGGPTNGN